MVRKSEVGRDLATKFLGTAFFGLGIALMVHDVTDDVIDYRVQLYTAQQTMTTPTMVCMR